MENHSDWIEFSNHIFSEKNISVDAIFVHGWGDLCDRTIKFVAEIFKKYSAKTILLNGHEHYEKDAPGLSYWKDNLVNKYKIPQFSIRSTAPADHTLAEAKEFINFAQSNDFFSAAVVSVPMHIGRAFLTNLGVMKERGLDLKLYPCAYIDIDWTKQIKVCKLASPHADEITSRLGCLMGECARIVEYRERYMNGDSYIIATVKEGLDYLNLLNKK